MIRPNLFGKENNGFILIASDELKATNNEQRFTLLA